MYMFRVSTKLKRGLYQCLCVCFTLGLLGTPDSHNSSQVDLSAASRREDRTNGHLPQNDSRPALHFTLLHTLADNEIAFDDSPFNPQGSVVFTKRADILSLWNVENGTL